MRTRSIIGPVLAVLYLAAIVALIVAAFDFAGSVEMRWVLVLIAVTLPGSLLAWLGLWSLVHGTDLGCFAFYFFICGVLNIWLMSAIVRKLR